MAGYKYLLIMASKQPFRFFDWKQKLTGWGIRLNKTIKHKVLSKSRNALIISGQSSSGQADKPDFETKLKSSLKKTWELYEVKADNYGNVDGYKEIEEKFKGRQYDAVIVMPEPNKSLSGYYNIKDEEFAWQTGTYTANLMKNLLAYRLAHKYLTTSGVVILSNSESDFGRVENKDGKLRVTQPALKNIQDAQLSYLTVIVGDRDYTDLNSWSVMGLS